MTILAFFTSNGAPATGLIPTIRIRKTSDKSLVVTDASMEELGDGHYMYNFTTGVDFEKYAFRCDGGATLTGEERYTYEGWEAEVDQEDGHIG